MAVHYFTASTLDGFLATHDDSLDWLLTRDVDADGPHGYNAFLAGMGALVMGGVTYRWVVEHEQGRWPYAQPTWLFSRSTTTLLPGADLRQVTGDPATHIDAIRESAGGRDVWLVGGGDLAAQFARAGLIDELWVQFAPVILGSGKPFMPAPLELGLLEVVRNGDFACTHYAVTPRAE